MRRAQLLFFLIILWSWNLSAQVMREQMITTAKTYVDVEWYCAPANINHSEYMDYGGRPCDFSVGRHTGEAYSYGGNDNVATFLSRIANGDGAGSHLVHYQAAGGTPWWASGIDCSAFVSRCWEIARQSTRTLPNYSTEIPRTEMLPGDILNIPANHVRLFDKRAADGRPIVYEASGSANKCVYRVVDWSSYSPRRKNELMISAPKFTVRNVGEYTLEVTWSAVPNANLYHLFFSTDGITFNDMGGSGELSRTFSDLSPGQEYYFRVQAKNSSSENGIMSEVLGCRVGNSPSNILVVNGFDRMSTGDNSQNYIVQHGNALSKIGYCFDSCSNETIEQGQIQLNDYAAVIWILGEESKDDYTFSALEQDRVEDFLEAGGNLFVSGAEIAWDLVEYSNGTSFYNNYLKAGYVADDANVYQVSGVPGSIFEGLTGIQFDDGSHGTYDVNWPDCIEPYGGSSVCLNYDGTSWHAAIQYEGTFGAGSQAGKLVYLGFPFETIYPASTREVVMSRIIDFFGIETYIKNSRANEKSIISEFRLHQNYPNPFNGSTIIQFGIPYHVNENFVTLTIYNLLGEQVKTLVSEKKSGGFFQVAWDGTDDNFQKVATGAYVYKLSMGKLNETKRMIFLE